MSKYPNTIVAVIIAILFASLGLVLLAPVFKADAGQVAILLGVLVIVLQQVIGLRTQEANGHRLTRVEKVAAAVTETVNQTIAVPPPVVVEPEPLGD